MASSLSVWRLSLLLGLAGGVRIKLSDNAKQSNSIESHSHNAGKARTKMMAHITEYPDYYHTVESLMGELGSLSKDCAHMTITSLEQGNVSLPVLEFDVKDSSEAANGKKMNVLFYFGEHAREAISPESGLRFAKDLCYKNAETKAMAEKVLSLARIRVVPVVNPSGHKLVEQGKFCQRTNAHGVDLNRNWDEHWQASTNPETFGGASPFSEVETQLLKKDAEQNKPDVFFTIHSGTLGLFTPWAFASAPAGDDAHPILLMMKQRLHREPETKSRITEMVELLNEVDPKYCSCDAGPAGSILPYYSYGTSLDFMFDKLKVDYSFAFEIYDGNSFGGYKYSKIDPRGKGFSCLEETESHMVSDMKNDQCFAFFNPTSETDLDKTTENWSMAYLEVLEGLVQLETKHGMFLSSE